jgi:hypothetical protein
MEKIRLINRKNITRRLKNEKKTTELSYFLENTNPYYCYIYYKNIVIIVEDAYPFKCPVRILINGTQDYLDFLIENCKRYTLKGDKCLHCKTLLCPENWSPMYKIIDIHSEVKSARKFFYEERKKDLAYKLNICQEMQQNIYSYL